MTTLFITLGVLFIALAIGLLIASLEFNDGRHAIAAGISVLAAICFFSAGIHSLSVNYTESCERANGVVIGDRCYWNTAK